MKRTLLLLFLVPAIAGAGGFSSLTVGARAISLGGTLLSYADDPNVLFTNPAGVAGIRSLSVSTSYSQLFPGISADDLQLISGSAVANLGFNGNVGLGLMSFQSTNWKEQLAIGTYAFEFSDYLLLGGSAKFFHWTSAAPSGDSKWTEVEGGLSKATISFDAGAQLILRDFLPKNDLRIGVLLGDITSPSIASDGSDAGKIDKRLSASVGYISHVYEYSVVVVFTQSGELRRYGLGTEIIAVKSDLLDMPFEFVVRGSIIQATLQGDVNGGIGLLLGTFGFDYGYGAPTELQYAGGTHHLTLRYTF